MRITWQEINKKKIDFWMRDGLIKITRDVYFIFFDDVKLLHKNVSILENLFPYKLNSI